MRSLKNLSSSPIVIFYVLDNNFLHTQLTFAFVPQKYFFNVHDDTDTFSLFLLQKDFDISGLFLAFVFFLFKKVLIPLTSFWSHSMFLIILFSIVIYKEKLIKNIFITFLYV